MNKFKFSDAGRVLKLNKAQTRVYESGGPAGDDFRREAKQAARDRSKKLRKHVEIYSFDGVCFEQLDPAD